MCKMLEDMRNEVALDSARKTAELMISEVNMSPEKIAKCLPLLTLDEIKEIAAKVMQTS